jgi:hypothetical protein
MKQTLLVVLMAASFGVLAATGGEGGNTNCNGVGNPNSPCVGTGGSNGNNGGGGSSGGTGVGEAEAKADSKASSRSNSNATNKTNVKTTIRSSNRTNVTNAPVNTNTNTATGGMGGRGGSANSKATGGNATVGDVTSTATGGNQSQTSEATANNAGNSQTITFSNPAAPSEVTITNTPDAYAPISAPTSPCRVAYSGGGSGPGFGISIGASALDEGCDTREDARLLHNMGLQNEAIARLCAKPELNAALGARCPKQPEKEKVNDLQSSQERP